MEFSEGQLIRDQMTCPDCREEQVSVKLNFETVGGMRVSKEVNGRLVIEARCSECGGTFYVKS
jgi:hypothetical protein